MGSSSAVEQSSDDFKIDARPLLLPSDRGEAIEAEENWQESPSYLPGQNDNEDDFSDLDALQAFRVEGSDNSGNRIFRIVGKFFPAPVVSAERLKKYIFHKIFTELPEGPFCVVYMHTAVHKEENSPGLTILRWIYEKLPSDYKDRLQVVYFVHPGLRARILFATLGRLFLSGGVFWKIKYVSRLQYIWEDIKKGEIEVPDFVQNHDDVLEHRPLMDYGIEPDPLHLTEIPSMGYPCGRYEEKWAAGETDYGIEPDPLHLTEAPSMWHSLERYIESWVSQE